MRSQHRDNRRASNEDELTTDDMQIALSFLKKRFNEYSLDQIMLSLMQHVQSNHQSTSFQSDQQDQRQEREDVRRPQPIPIRTRITHKNRDQRQLRENISSISVNNEEKLNKSEEMRLVAKFFCETGVNYNLVRYFFPQMTPQQYRSYIEAINNQTINQIQKYLRYECNIQIQHISTDQKRSLKNQLIKVRDWLGQKSVSQLQTYYKFIQRQYEHKSVQISYDQALKLYKTLLKIIKSPHVDIMQIVEDQQSQIPQIYNRTNRTSKNVPIGSFTKQEEKRVIQFILKYKNLDKVIQKLNVIHGQNSKWTKKSINMVIKHSLKRAIKKIVLSKQKYLRKGPVIYFGTNQLQIDRLLEDQQLKQAVLNFYLVSRTTMTQLSKIISDLNTFFNTESNSAEIELISSDDECSIIPKMQFTIKIQRSNEAIPEPSLKQQTMFPQENINDIPERQHEDTSLPIVKQDPQLDKLTAAQNYEQFIEID